MKNGKFSIRESYSNRNILIAGASGFLGKVWLSYVLTHLQEIESIHILMRRKGVRSAHQRFELALNSSYVFQPVHELFGDAAEEILQKKVFIYEGDLSHAQFGLEDEEYNYLLGNMDLLINCAGLVEFNPDVRDAFSANVRSVMQATRFIEESNRASLLHVSTCYVCGSQSGSFKEEVADHRSPNGKHVDIGQEVEWIEKETQRILHSHESLDSDPEILSAVEGKLGEEHSLESPRARNMIKLLQRRKLRQEFIQLGKDRAESFGWPNTYTYSKYLAELHLRNFSEKSTSVAILRPSIVESSESFPFPGWNEGFNTSGPLAYLLATWFRFLPSTPGNPFDVIPVDHVAKGMVVAGAHLLNGDHSLVYHCATSDLSPFTIDRACELTSLGHRRHYRTNGSTFIEKAILSRWDAISVPKTYALSVRKIRKFTSNWSEKLSGLTAGGNDRSFLGAKLEDWTRALQNTDRKLRQIEDLLNLFLPFIHDHYQVFETRNLQRIAPIEEDFAFSPQKIDWPGYWLDIQIPGLRRWCFPSIEGKETETLNLASPIKLLEPVPVTVEEERRVAI